MVSTDSDTGSVAKRAGHIVGGFSFAMPECIVPINLRPTGGALDYDPYGQAALLLVESILHALVANATFSADEAVTVLSIAIEVNAEQAADVGGPDGSLARSLQLLTAIKASFEADAGSPEED